MPSLRDFGASTGSPATNSGGGDAITRDESSFHPKDVILIEGELWHEGPAWPGTVQDFKAEGDAQRLGIEWLRLGEAGHGWTALLLRGGPVAVAEKVSDLRAAGCRGPVAAPDV
ncbi:hypothetical protein [Paracoccus alkenifer]|uniref:Uncharacterized protein n=1 Tax=Paracoccus alkenifer TaxID=65735 RepID=A0A1H6MNY2_9RHOB|nr:hypothetical protein [Paracoccus alkenifer]SEI03548.1 hypothetical protein SAMN04488075_2345 [Paracoccus alkenifer]